MINFIVFYVFNAHLNRVMTVTVDIVVWSMDKWQEQGQRYITGSQETKLFEMKERTEV